jgi:D-alanyl-D-alanine carboxypeptidase (penicillin-binding protein 5/6)
MEPKIKIQGKIISLLVVLIMFSLVGGLLIFISYNNKVKTDNLKIKVLEQRRINLKKQILNNIVLATSTLPEIKSRAYLTAIMVDGKIEKILQEKNPDLVLPIASISKLLTTVVAKENINLKTEVTATAEYIGDEESYFVIEPNRKYLVKDIMANALIASDNDSARLLAGIFNENIFIEKINTKARELDMLHTSFVNSSGLDTKDPVKDGLNVSTVNDLAKLIIYMEDKHPDLLALTRNKEFNFCDTNNFCKVIKNTNKLLDLEDFPLDIVAGKTGTTDLALKNLLLLTKLDDGINIINIVLGSEDNFADTLSLINNIKINK